VRVAALFDVHANLPALDAVLLDVERARVDVVLFGGDIVVGPFPRATLDRVRGIPDARFVLGNADVPDPSSPIGVWLLDQLTGEDVAFARGFEERVVIDGVLYRHGSPRSLDEMVTPLTPDDALREMLAGITERVVGIGHTHVQFDRVVDGYRVVNAGSVGLAYEGRRGAYWAVVDGGDVQLRRTDYDAEAAARAVPREYPDRDDLVGWLLDPPTAYEAASFFEQQAGRMPAG
jgi:predicted phosphodiesterase